MSSNLPYSLNDIQQRVHTLVENDNDTPTSTDDEYEIRLNLINQSIGKWESEDVLWRELWTSYTHGSTVSSATTYTLSSLTDMRFPGASVQLVLNGSTSNVEIVDPHQSVLTHGNKVVWFTGNNKDGWTLNLSWTPTSGDGTYGATIKVPYYKYATRFTTSDGSVEPEMSDPNYIVYDVAAAKSLMESRNNQFSIYNTEALIRLDKMKQMNEATPHYQNQSVEDTDTIVYGAVMGD